MKKMLLAIFLMVFSNWCLIFGYTDQLPVLLYIGLLFPIPAMILTYIGYKEK